MGRSGAIILDYPAHAPVLSASMPDGNQYVIIVPFGAFLPWKGAPSRMGCPGGFPTAVRPCCDGGIPRAIVDLVHVLSPVPSAFGLVQLAGTPDMAADILEQL